MMNHFILYFVAFAVCISFCSSTKSTECVLSATESCSISSLSDITSVFPGGETRCAFENDGKVGPKANSTYYFQVFPGRNADKNKVMLYFQGGGACLSHNDCSFDSQCGFAFWKINARSQYDGIFDRQNADNPFKDWTIIHVLYCTGDIHVGNKVRKFSPKSMKEKMLNFERFASIEDTFTKANIPSTSDSTNVLTKRKLMTESKTCYDLDLTAHHVGAVNTQAVLKWMYANFPNPEYLVISGCSAGALGAQVHSHNIIQKYEQELKSNAIISVVADSYVGVGPSPNTASYLFNLFDACEIEYGQTKEMMEMCLKGTLATTTFVKRMVSQHPKIPFTFVNSKSDMIQIAFHALFPDGHGVSAKQFYVKMSQMLSDYATNLPNVLNFMVEGSKHCLTPRDLWLKVQSSSGDKSMMLTKWMQDVSHLEEKPIYSYCIGEQKDSMNMDVDSANSLDWCDSNVMKTMYTRQKSAPSTPTPSVNTPGPTINTPSPTVISPMPTVSTPKPTDSTPKPIIVTPTPAITSAVTPEPSRYCP